MKFSFEVKNRTGLRGCSGDRVLRCGRRHPGLRRGGRFFGVLVAYRPRDGQPDLHDQVPHQVRSLVHPPSPSPEFEARRRRKPRRHRKFRRHHRPSVDFGGRRFSAVSLSSDGLSALRRSVCRPTVCLSSHGCQSPDSLSVIRRPVCHSTVCPSPDGLSVVRRSVHHPTVCPSSDGLSFTRRSVCRLTVCLSSGGLSITQRSVLHPTVCPSPDGLSFTRRSVCRLWSVHHPTVCPSSDGLSFTRRSVCPKVSHL